MARFGANITIPDDIELTADQIAGALAIVMERQLKDDPAFPVDTGRLKRFTTVRRAAPGSSTLVVESGARSKRGRAHYMSYQNNLTHHRNQHGVDGANRNYQFIQKIVRRRWRAILDKTFRALGF